LKTYETTLTQYIGGAERQLTTPWSGTFAGVSADVEDILGGRLKSVDNDGRVGGVGRPVFSRVVEIVVQQLV